MTKVLSLILKQRKIIFFILLLLVAGGLLSPTITHAEISLENGLNLLFIDSVHFVSGAFRMYADVATSLLGNIIDKLLEKQITKLEFTNYGWTAIRDIANMLIVLGFVVVGVATTLRIQDYQAKKLLPSLIIVALLVNFSLLFVGIIIDASKFVMDSLLGDGGASGSFGKGIYLDIRTPYKQLISDAYLELSNLDKFDFIIKIVLFCFMFFVIGTTFIYYVFMFFERYVMLFILAVISPLAFFAWIFPVTRKYFKMWMEQLIKWAFIGVAGAFFINIAIKLLDSYKEAGTKIVPTNLLDSPDFFPLLMVSILLFIGLKVTKKNSGIVASSIMGLAGAAVGMAAGYATAGGSIAAKKLARATGATETGRNIGHRATRIAERIGWVKSGTSAKWEKERIEKDKKQYENMTSNQLAAEVNTGAATTAGRRANDIKAHILAERKDLDKVKESKRDAVVMRAIQNDKTGTALPAFRNTNPRYAEFDNEKIEKNLKKIDPNLTLKKASEPQLATAKRQAVAEAVQKVAPGDAAKWTPDVVTPEVFSSLRKNQLIEMGKRGTPGLVEKLKKYRRATDEITGAPLMPNDPNQNEEYKALKNHIDTVYGRPSPERDKVVELIKELERPGGIFN